MALRNTKTRYGGVAKTFHWLTALLVLTLIPLGIFAHGAPATNGDEIALKALLFSIHKTLGVTVFFVALARILWAFTGPKPALLNADNRPEAFLAQTIHWLLYSALLLVPVTGWITHAASEGFAPIWGPFGQDLPLVPKSEAVVVLFSALHFTFERVLAFSILLHIAGALKHHVIDRDPTLLRMLPGRPALPDLPDAPHAGRLPVIAAVVAYVLALIAGTFLWYLPGMERLNSEEVARIELPVEAEGNWQVESGTLALNVRQFGSDLGGEFSGWSASITFDEHEMFDKAGEVTVTIDIASLSLGSVTGQALGADFFDAATWPTALFEADIMPVADGYEAVGTLTIRDQTLPLTLAFGLYIEDDLATMDGSIVLQRLDFHIGENIPDAATLGFDVLIEIDLTARRGEG